MAQRQEPRIEETTERETAQRPDAVAVISAYGAFRVLLVLLAIWTFIEGFALFTGSLEALTLGGQDRPAERIIGAHMILIAPVYVLLAWRRERYSLLIWMPYAAQLAIILPLLWSLVRDEGGRFDGLLLLVVSTIFLVLLVYLRVSAHPADFFRTGEEEEEEELDEDDEYDDEDQDIDDEDEDLDEDEGEDGGVPEDEELPPSRDEPRLRPRRYRRK